MVYIPKKKTPELLDYLFDDEKQFVKGDFREYFLRKRFNFRATTNNSPEISSLFFDVDQLWLEMLPSLETISNVTWPFPCL